MTDQFAPGGTRAAQPFRVSRLGHFGINVDHISEVLRFYTEMLGFRVSDPIDFGPRISPGRLSELGGDGRGYFMRHGTDHHSFVIFPRGVYNELNHLGDEFPEVTTNQITWQVGSLQEVVDGNNWFNHTNQRVQRAGRDTPGSNWHSYLLDPEGHVNEIYYGIEQIGWDQRSKPADLHRDHFRDVPALPQRSEFSEVVSAVGAGVDPHSGFMGQELLVENVAVGGVLLARPFKIVRIGPVRLFVDNVDVATDFYRNSLGLTATESVIVDGFRCSFLRANTEHHSIALYPKPLRSVLGFEDSSTLLAIGMQIANFDQLREARDFFESAGVSITHLPAELTPGIDYSFVIRDPSGHRIHFYHAMDQIGWDGFPRPPERRTHVDNANWPSHVDGNGAQGEIYLGPWS